jgi:hypothetical protein
MSHTTAPSLGTSAVLYSALATAALAPSIHNTQPWHWRIHGSVADLYADTRRRLRVVDSENRQVVLSCGGALHHARLALAAAGFTVGVATLPTREDPLHLARIHVGERRAPTEETTRLRSAIPNRRTDRRPLSARSPSEESLSAVERMITEAGSQVYWLRGSEVGTLADAVAQARREAAEDPASRRELDQWAAGSDDPGVGFPAGDPGAVPAAPRPTRDIDYVATMPSGADGGVFGIIHGPTDTAPSWLASGAALSGAWLEATVRGIAVLPLSAPTELMTTRQRLHRILAGRGAAHIAVRFGVPDPTVRPAARTARLPAADPISFG